MPIQSGATVRVAFSPPVADVATIASGALPNTFVYARLTDRNGPLLEVGELTSNEVTANRQETTVRSGFQQVSGSLGFELAFGGQDILFELATNQAFGSPFRTTILAAGAATQVTAAAGTWTIDDSGAGLPVLDEDDLALVRIPRTTPGDTTIEVLLRVTTSTTSELVGTFHQGVGGYADSTFGVENWGGAAVVGFAGTEHAASVISLEWDVSELQVEVTSMDGTIFTVGEVIEIDTTAGTLAGDLNGFQAIGIVVEATGTSILVEVIQAIGSYVLPEADVAASATVGGITYIYTGAGSAVSAGAITYSTIVKEYPDVPLAQAFGGVTVATLNLTASPDSLITGTVDLLGVEASSLDTEYGSETIAPNPGAASSAYSPFSSCVAINSEANPVVSSFNITVENNRSTLPLLCTPFAASVFEGVANVSGTMTLLFESASEYNLFANETEVPVTITFDAGTADGSQWMVVHIPRSRFTQPSFDVPASGPVVLTLNFRGLEPASGPYVGHSAIFLKDPS